MPLDLEINGRTVTVGDPSRPLLEVLRESGCVSVKDGCSPQGQCGCCTVLVDGSPRVSCVTPVRRVAGRSVTTLEGLSAAERASWGGAFAACGASQCGFCTPGIILRLEGLRRKRPDADDAAVEQALKAHLCRCTGWRTIVEAFALPVASPGRDEAAAARRAAIEGGVPQRVAPDVALGLGGFADDSAPPDALVAVPDGSGGYALGETLAEARLAAGKVQGRRTTVAPQAPVPVPPGDWAFTLQTSWVEPGYLETDASWCRPGGEPADPLGNGGAFGGKSASPVAGAARDLADRTGRPVRVLWSREDCVRLGSKRPPLAAGIDRDGGGRLDVVATPGVAEAVATAAPGLEVREVTVPGPPTSVALRGAGWAEAAVLAAAARDESGRVTRPGEGTAEATVEDGHIRVRVACGDPLDDVVLRSYCIGAAHMALGWVTSEALTVDEDGTVHDLTVRSFGILSAADTPPIDVVIEDEDGPPRRGSDVVFAAVASAVWAAQGFSPRWPTGRRLFDR